MNESTTRQIIDTFEDYIDIEETLSNMFNKFGVPGSGKADNQAGEMVRAMCKIRYRWYNDGDKINWCYGRETCNAPARYLMTVGGRAIRGYIRELFNEAPSLSNGEYKQAIKELSILVIRAIDDNPDWSTKETEDMWDYYDKEEDDESIDYDDEEEEW